MLVVFHVGFLWLENPHSIDVDLISAITGLSRAGWDLVETFEEGKHPDKISHVQEKYGLVSSSEYFLISSINDRATRMEATILTHKMLHISRPKQCTAGIVMLVALYVEGVQINLSQLLLNELL